jgi:outer membrane protein OmpA-like peptidoglycan-associated protein
MLEEMRAVVIGVALATLARAAVAAPPNEYACDPGKPKKGVGCECPAGYADGRDVGDVAVCVEKKRPPDPPKPPDEVALANTECKKVDAALVRAFGADLTGEEQKAFRTAFGAAVVQRCQRATWHKDGRRCLAAASLVEQVYDCVEKLPPVERTGIEVDAARAHPIGATLDKDGSIRTRNAIVFATTTAAMSDVSRAQVEAVAKIMLASPRPRIEVQVHSDNAKDGERLTNSRAIALRAALIAAGVPADRVTARGYGSERPIASNDSAWGRARNRRVAFAKPLLPDRDRDGIPDVDDKCPDDAETYNGFQDDDGCVDTPPRIIAPRGAPITARVLFEPARAQILPAMFPMLDDIARSLRDDPAARARVIGHADATEGDLARVSKARADAVRDHLVKAGIDARRLITEGVGATRPASDGTTAEARAKNRFVELVLVEPPK